MINIYKYIFNPLIDMIFNFHISGDSFSNTKSGERFLIRLLLDTLTVDHNNLQNNIRLQHKQLQQNMQERDLESQSIGVCHFQKVLSENLIC